jgi:hypothetical protein
MLDADLIGKANGFRSSRDCARRTEVDITLNPRSTHYPPKWSVLQPISRLEHPPHGREAHGQGAEGHPQADADRHVRRAVEAPAKPIDQEIPNDAFEMLSVSRFSHLGSWLAVS